MTTERKPVIGVLGGIGSGKSAVAEALVRHGGAIINADQLGHEALLVPEIKERVVARWGRDLLDESGNIVRKKLGAIVFADAKELKALEALVHPWIGDRIRQRIEELRILPEVRFIVLDAAIMLEAGWSGVCDRLIFVDVPREERLARLRTNRGWSAAELEAREVRQLPLTEKAAKADHVLVNDGTLDDLRHQVDDLVAGWSWLSRPVSV
jgi:dephospho-CoA kinase